MYNLNLDDFPSGLPEELMSILKPKNHQREFMTEDCFVLSLRELGKGLLKADGLMNRKTGTLTLGNRFDDLSVEYSVIPGDGENVLAISCRHKNSVLKQMIQIQKSIIHYGVRPYLTCACGYRGNNLYLSNQQYSFLCRNCAGLYYECTAINRKSGVGALRCQLARKFKIAMLQERVKRVSYKGKFTKQARRVMELVK